MSHDSRVSGKYQVRKVFESPHSDQRTLGVFTGTKSVHFIYRRHVDVPWTKTDGLRRLWSVPGRE